MNTNYNIFVNSFNINSLIVNIFINNIKIIGVKRLDYIKKVKKKFAIIFKIIDIGFINFYLDLKIERNC